MKTFGICLLTLLLITGLGGCERCSDGYYLDINEMKINAVRYNLYGNLAEVKENRAIPFDSLFILASFSGQSYGLNRQKPAFGFLPAAVASSDDCPGLLGTKEAIADITVITLTDFDDDFKANDTINSLIKATGYLYSGYGDEGFKKLDQYLTDSQPKIFFAGGEGAFYLKLTKKPTQKNIKIRVDVAFTNGEKYSSETSPVTIKL